MAVRGELKEFSGKRIFITGHTGFKGSWLSYWLQTLGAIVKGFSLPPITDPNLFSLLELSKSMESVIGNINNYSTLADALIKFQPDFVFHLAAQPLVRKSYKEPLDTFQTNVIGTANILEALKYLDKPCICICITTDKVYQNNEWIYPYRENDPLGGYDPYSASKACSEMVISSFTNSYFSTNTYRQHQKAIASARAGNVIGGGDWSEDRLLPDIVRSLADKKDIIIRNPAAVRPWQHVMEPLAGYLQLALSLQQDVTKYTGAWNFGPHTEDNFSVLELSKMAIHIWGEGNLKVSRDVNAPHEAHLLRLDISKATGELNWFPKMRAEEAIKRTIQWYKAFYSGSNVKKLVEEDLKHYQSLFN
jgi:CDP-glucose 4,6-dehydratase